MRSTGLGIVLAISIVGCGIPQEEHDKALTDQKSVFDTEMQKMRDEQAQLLLQRQNHITKLEEEVQRLGGNLAAVKAEAEALDEKLGVKSIELETARKQIAVTGEQLAATQAELEQVRKLRETAERAAQSFRELAVKLKAMVDAGKLEVVTRKGRMMLKLPDDILFPPGSTQLKKEGTAALVSVAEVLRDVQGRDFLVAGHTDNVPIKRGGSFASNWDLSTARAVRVVKLMVENGVAPERLAAAGYGEIDPIAPNDNAEGRSKNRRLEIILMPNIDELPQLPR